MDREEYQAIHLFLYNGAYPSNLSTSKEKWNFRRKTTTYFIAESRKICKVHKIKFLFFNIIKFSNF